jgi:hypothetical protein
MKALKNPARREPRPTNLKSESCVREKLSRSGKAAWRPETPLGKKLLALSNRYREERLSSEAIADEVREISVRTIFQA